jgi:hypothetical protein
VAFADAAAGWPSNRFTHCSLPPHALRTATGTREWSLLAATLSPFWFEPLTAQTVAGGWTPGAAPALACPP